MYRHTLGSTPTCFFGFDLAQISHLISEADIKAAGVTPPVDALRDCVYFPDRQALYTLAGERIDVSSPTYMEPDLKPIASLDSKLANLDRSRARDRAPDTMAIPDQLERVETPVLLFGRFIRHYGHFITDCLARLWDLDSVAADVPILAYGGPKEDFYLPYERVIGQALGLAPRRLSPDRPTLFSTVICPTPAIQLGRRVYDVFDRPHRRIGEAIAPPASFTPEDRPVYLSRRGLGSEHRRIEGEEALEAKLEREGFAVVQPETLSFEEQVRLFQSRQPIVGPMGSALHTVLFRDAQAPPARLALLSDERIHHRFLLVDAVKKAHSNYLCCMEGPPPGEDEDLVPLQARQFRIDADLALGMLSEAGLLPGSRRTDQEDFGPAPRFHVEGDLDRGAQVVLAKGITAGPSGRKIARDDALRLFNGRDGEWLGRAVKPGGGGCTVLVKGKLKAQTTPSELVLAASVPNQAAARSLVRSAVAAGVGKLCLLQPERRGLWGGLDRKALMAEVVEAAELAERLDVPELDIDRSAADLIDAWRDRPMFYWSEEPLIVTAGQGSPPRANSLLKSMTSPDADGPVLIALFSVGALSAQERASLRRMPTASEVSLGKRNLPLETAAMVAVSVWQAKYGEFR